MDGSRLHLASKEAKDRSMTKTVRHNTQDRLCLMGSIVKAPCEDEYTTPHRLQLSRNMVAVEASQLVKHRKNRKNRHTIESIHARLIVGRVSESKLVIDCPAVPP